MISMRLLFVADGRSPIALNWIEYFVQTGHEVHLVSTFNFAPDLAFASLHIVPVAFSSFRSREMGEIRGISSKRSLLRLIPVGLRTSIRQWLGPITLQGASRRLAKIIRDIQPDLVHAMRIPYEGMTAALALEDQRGLPLIISVWGNDFTLHAASTARMGRLTHQAMSRADALHTDCQRDARLAIQWGYDPEKPVRVLPGSGGVKLDVFSPGDRAQDSLPDDTLMVTNPRGLRAYVRNDTFFKAIPLAIRENPRIRFLCTAMQAEPEAERWLKVLEIENWVTLLPLLQHADMAPLFRRSQIIVSPSEHDGTPNTLLEAMACGCFPVAGDLESIREWIVPGVNGLLFNPSDPADLAQAILVASNQPDLRKAAQEYNTRLVANKAEYRQVLDQALSFYLEVLASRPAYG